jgi:hypothetical protein
MEDAVGVSIDKEELTEGEVASSIKLGGCNL